MEMENDRFILEPVNSNKFVRILQVAFGIVCIIVALTWVVLNLTTFKSSGSVWLTIVFLICFGYFQIISGLGLATKFIEYRKSELIMKPHSFLPLRKISVPEIEKIEIYPLSILFFLNSQKKAILRFGTNYTDIIPSVKDGTEKFAGVNNIPLSYKSEDI